MYRETCRQQYNYAGKEKKVSHRDLFKNKCTQCHEAERAKEMHASKATFLEIIKKMMGKGAKVTDEEAKSIADFLGTPSRFLFEEKCTKCHGLNRIIEAHQRLLELSKEESEAADQAEEKIKLLSR